MYVSMKEMLQKANRENYAVMAINCFNLETAKAVIDAAAESHAPIIVDLLQDHLKTHLDHRYLTQPIIRMAENANVEVAINLDHGQDIAFVKQCLHEGFSSVMMDASMHPLEKTSPSPKRSYSLRKPIMPVSKQKLGTWEQWLGISLPAMGCIPIQRKPSILFEQPGSTASPFLTAPVMGIIQQGIARHFALTSFKQSKKPLTYRWFCMAAREPAEKISCVPWH